MPRRNASIRRPFRQTGPRRVPPALRHANALIKKGNYAEAALAFEKIAQRADSRRDARAPIFHLRAGRAYILAKNTQNGMPHLKRGLTVLAAKKRWDALQRFGQRAVDELEELGLNQEAQEIATLLEKRLSQKRALKSRATLPRQCAYCGAPVHPNEVKWIDEDLAECVFCGNPLRGED